MKKTTAIIGVMASSVLASPAMAAKVDVSGFVDTVFTLSDGTVNAPATSPIENKFQTTGELDFKSTIDDKVNARVDIDYDTFLIVEQARLDWKANSTISVTGGIFNNPIGWEKEDAPDLYQISHGQIWAFLDGQTALWGNNVAGVMVNVGTTPELNISAGILNDLSDVNEENSFAFTADYNTKEMGFGLGVVTQDAQAETLIDINGQINVGKAMIGGEVLLAGAGVDLAFGITGVMKVNDRVSATARFDNVSYEAPGANDTRSITLAGSFALSRSLTANAEIRLNDETAAGIQTDGDLIQFELIAAF